MRLLLSQKNNNLHPAFELSDITELMTVCQIESLLEKKAKKKKKRKKKQAN